MAVKPRLLPIQTDIPQNEVIAVEFKHNGVQYLVTDKGTLIRVDIETDSYRLVHMVDLSPPEPNPQNENN